MPINVFLGDSSSNVQREELFTGVAGYVVQDAEYIITQSGKRVDVPTMDILVLPASTKNNGWMNYKQLIELLADSNIAIYDPTNGLKSDGDIIRSDANRR